MEPTEFDLSTYNVSELVELRDAMLFEVSQYHEMRMTLAAKVAKSLADQCDAELQNREVK